MNIMFRSVDWNRDTEDLDSDMIVIDYHKKRKTLKY